MLLKFVVVVGRDAYREMITEAVINHIQHVIVSVRAPTECMVA